ncbi:MAG: DUF4215 domain-containing protein [bacterium]
MRGATIGLTLVSLAASAFGAGCATGKGPQAAECGDGLLDVDTEICDDGNLLPGDGCDASCIAETGYSCVGDAPTVCTPNCGDGLVVAGENCDGADLSGQTCETLDLGAGSLACGPTCAFDSSGCSASLCGNGALDPMEQCEGTDLGGMSCFDLQYDEGTLACTNQCVFDTTGCFLASCGNGVIEGIEECDDGDTDAGDGCGPNCAVEQGWTCAGAPSQCAQLCGNGAIDAGEQCDGADLGGYTCPSVDSAYVGGTLGCLVTCRFDTSLCETPTCGNGAIDAGEQCDGVLLNGQTCQTVGAYIGGTLYCSPTCAFNVNSCVPLVCGDGIVSAGEACDDGNTTTGDGCNALCQVESGWECSGSPSSCSRLCGNALLDPGEVCDGPLLGGETCVTLGYDAGTLACSSSCSFDLSGCYMYVCGNSTVEPGEECDGSNLNGASCLSLGFTGGALACTGNCTYNTGGCTSISCGDSVCNGSETSCSCPGDCGDTCGDGCCTGSEASTCPLDCGGCPGLDYGGTCYYLVDLEETSKASAISQCSALGAGWGLCTSTQLCQSAVYTYLSAGGCACSGGSTACNCLYANVYVHVSDFTLSAWINVPEISGCSGGSCAESGSGDCGAVLCCN